MTEEHDDWQTGSGLLSNYDGTVTNAWFSTDVDYQQGKQLLLFLEMTAIDEDGTEIEGHVERYSPGADWASYDGGESMEHPQGGKRKINNQSQYGKLIDAALTAGGAETLRSRGSAKSAGVWVGTKWHFDEVSTTYANLKDDNGNPVTSRKNYPAKFLGLVEDGGQGKAPEQVLGQTGGAAEERSDVAVEESGKVEESPNGQEEQASDSATNGLSVLSSLTPETSMTITQLAKEQDYASWVDQVMGLTGVVDNDSLIVALADEAGLYSQLKSA